jgi:hypothetical protein
MKRQKKLERFLFRYFVEELVTKDLGRDIDESSFILQMKQHRL